MFLVQHQCFWFQNKQQKTEMFGQKGGCNKTGFFYEPVFCKLSKVIVFLAIFCHFWLLFKTYYKIGISGHFKSQKLQKMAFFNGY